MKNNAKFHIKNIIIILLATIIILTIIAETNIFFSKNKLKVLPYEKNYSLKIKEVNLEGDVKLKIDNLFNFKYFYKETDNFKGLILGKSIPLYRTVIVKKNLKEEDPEEYALALTHELCHLKYNTYNDTFINYMTFKTLYECEDEALQTIGFNFGVTIIEGGYEGNNYDCGYYILEYFKEKKVL